MKSDNQHAETKDKHKCVKSLMILNTSLLWQLYYSDSGFH